MINVSPVNLKDVKFFYKVLLRAKKLGITEVRTNFKPHNNICAAFEVKKLPFSEEYIIKTKK